LQSFVLNKAALRYLGNKTSLVHEIYGLLDNHGLVYKNLTFFDAFCGTGSVSASLKSAYNIIANDNLKWCTQYTCGRLNVEDANFDRLGFDPFKYFLENKDIIHGFFYKTYSPGGSQRKYFTAKNAGRIDYIRQTIEKWNNEKLLTNAEYCYLLYCLFEAVSKVSNTTGVYGAFLKHWDPRSQKDINFCAVSDNQTFKNEVTIINERVEDIISKIDCDILYLDPPYTQNQYGTQYHLLETLALNDNPDVSEITGSRSTAPMRSDWSKDVESHVLFEKVVATTKAKYIVFSYSIDGFLNKSFIESVLKRYGVDGTYMCKKIGYKKYRNFKNRTSKNHHEYLFFVEKKEDAKVIYESPLNYTGSKYRVIEDIKEILPYRIDTFYDLFGGGFNVGANLNQSLCKRVVYNDINCYVSKLMEAICENDTIKTIKYINKLIKKFGLEPKDKESYYAIREYYNSRKNKINDPLIFFTTIMYGFQQQIRFNSNHEFNNPVGMRWFNEKVKEKLISFSRHVKSINCTFSCVDYLELENLITDKDLVYLDPPYRLTTGAYNDGKRGFNGWTKLEEKKLLDFIERLHKRGVKFIFSYVLKHNGTTNEHIQNWLSENNFELKHLDVKFANSKKRDEVLIFNFIPENVVGAKLIEQNQE
jgi:adenine-specific DNA-methyltransferase